MTSPATLSEFQARLQDLSGHLPKRLMQCADFIARNTDRIACSTVADLAGAAGVQPSAVIRFCQLMGFSGFSDMQRLFREAAGQRYPDYTVRLEKLRAGGADSPSALLAEFVDAGRASLGNLAATLETAALDRAVDLLAGAGMIHLVGLRRAFPVASYMAYALEKMAVPSILHDRVGQISQAQSLRSGDVMVAITFAPYTQDTLGLASAARAAGMSVIGITDALNSPLHRMGALPLVISELDVGDFRTLSASFALAQALSVAVGARRSPK